MFLGGRQAIPTSGSTSLDVCCPVRCNENHACIILKSLLYVMDSTHINCTGHHLQSTNIKKSTDLSNYHLKMQFSFKLTFNSGRSGNALHGTTVAKRLSLEVKIISVNSHNPRDVSRGFLAN